MTDMPLLVAIASTHHSHIAERFKVSEQVLNVLQNAAREFL